MFMSVHTKATWNCSEVHFQWNGQFNPWNFSTKTQQLLLFHESHFVITNRSSINLKPLHSPIWSEMKILFSIDISDKSLYFADNILTLSFLKASTVYTLEKSEESFFVFSVAEKRFSAIVNIIGKVQCYFRIFTACRMRVECDE